MKVFVDTSAFYALASASDEFHGPARALYEKLLREDAELLTSSYVLVESFALIQSRLGFAVLREFVSSIEGLLRIIWVDERLHRRAWELLEKRQTVSLVDCASFLIAKAEGCQVFAFDEDFAREGLAVLPPIQG
jgi:predicted nucleic acid-binding protein